MLEKNKIVLQEIIKLLNSLLIEKKIENNKKSNITRFISQIYTYINVTLYLNNNINLNEIEDYDDVLICQFYKNEESQYYEDMNNFFNIIHKEVKSLKLD